MATAQGKELEVSIGIKADNQTARGMKAAGNSIRANLGRETDLATFKAKKLAAAWKGVHGSIRGAMSGAFGGFTGAVGLGGVLSVGGIAAGLVEGTKSFIEQGAAVDDLRKRTGLAVDFLGELQYASKMAGIDSGELTKNVVKLQKSLFELQNVKGGGKFGAFLKDFGPDTAKKLKTMDTREAFTYLLDLLPKIEDPLKRNALAMAAFGKGGASVSQVAEDLSGSGGFKAVAKEARDLGVVLSDEVAKKAGAADDAMVRLHSAIQGAFAGNIGGGGLDKITGVFDSLTESIKNPESPLAKSLAEFSGSIASVDWVKTASAMTDLATGLVKFTAFIIENNPFKGWSLLIERLAKLIPDSGMNGPVFGNYTPTAIENPNVNALRPYLGATGNATFNAPSFPTGQDPKDYVQYIVMPKGRKPFIAQDAGGKEHLYMNDPMIERNRNEKAEVTIRLDLPPQVKMEPQRVETPYMLFNIQPVGGVY